MSIKLMTQVWESSFTSGNTRMILLALADMANDEGVCWPSVATLAAKANCSRRSAERALAELEKLGLAGRDRRSNSSNIYRLTLDGQPPRQNDGSNGGMTKPSTRQNDGSGPDPSK